MLLTAQCGSAVLDQLAQCLLNIMPMALMTGNCEDNISLNQEFIFSILRTVQSI
jgi:hypothetical protein